MANTKRIEKWVKALRSGKYRQGQNALRPTDGTFCCLGVACDLYAKENKGAKWVRLKSTKDYWGRVEKTKAYGFTNTRAYSLLPKKVAKWLGISDKQETLIGMNDNGEPFRDIAKVIEKKYLTK